MLLTLLSLSLGSSLKQNPIDGKVDFTCPATRAEIVLSQLSEKTGLKLKASAAVAPDVLVIHVQGVGVRDLLGKIAAAAGSQWEIKGDTAYLEPARDVERHQHQAITREYEGRLRPALQKLLGSDAYHQVWNQSVAQKLAIDTEKAMNPESHSLSGADPSVRNLIGRGPASRLAISLLGAIGPDQLSEHMGEPRTVYATSPTSMQVGVQPAQGTLDEFLQEETAFVNATKAYIASQPPSSTHMMMSGIDRGELRGGDPSKGMGQVLVAVLGSYWTDSVRAYMTAADGANKILTDGYAMISLEPRTLKTFQGAGDDSPIPVDGLTNEFKSSAQPPGSGNVSSMSMATVQGGTSKRLDLKTPDPIRSSSLSPALLGWLNTPATNEPLRLCTGSLLMSTALKRSENLVADLDDRSFPDALRMCDGKTTPSKWLSSEALQRFQDVSEDSGWLVVGPRDVAGARKNRINRGGLQELLSSMQKRKILTLDALGRYAQSQYAEPVSGGFDYEYMLAVNPAATGHSYDQMNWDMYTVYGALDPQQREGLKNGGTFDLSSLNANAIEAVRRKVFDSAAVSPVLTDRDGKPTDMYGQGIIEEWTQLLPDGVPPLTGLSAKVESQPAAYCLSLIDGAAQIMSLADLAREQFLSQSENFRQYASPLRFDRFVPAEETKYHFHLLFAPGIALEADLSDAAFDDSADARSMAEMPSDYRDAINKEFAELQAAFGHVSFSSGATQSAQP